MPGTRYFLDSNILVYANDDSDSKKRSIAVRLILEGLREERAVVSSQVLGEFWVTVTRKISVPLDLVTAEAELERFRVFRIVSVDYDTVKAAVSKQKNFRLSYWDALILTTAEFAGCEIVYSEDFESGRRYGGVMAVNPFIAGGTF